MLFLPVFYSAASSFIKGVHNDFFIAGTTPETPESIEHRKHAIFHEVLYGRGDKVGTYPVRGEL